MAVTASLDFQRNYLLEIFLFEWSFPTKTRRKSLAIRDQLTFPERNILNEIFLSICRPICFRQNVFYRFDWDRSRQICQTKSFLNVNFLKKRGWQLRWYYANTLASEFKVTKLFTPLLLCSIRSHFFATTIDLTSLCRVSTHPRFGRIWTCNLT